jgi:hypothetical protein
MKTIFSNHAPPLRHLTIGLLGLGLGFQAAAENVFQANLSTSGGSAQLNFGRIYLRVEEAQVDFMAVIFPFGSLTDNLNPVLTGPGDSFNFSLGAGTRTWLHGTHTVADQNPFLPAPPWLPHSYDENGNPLYLDATVIRLTDIYTGQFTLPDGFADDLLAGLGHISFNSSLGGIITVATVPEPTTGTLLLLAGWGWSLRRRWGRGAEFQNPSS